MDLLRASFTWYTYHRLVIAASLGPGIFASGWRYKRYITIDIGRIEMHMARNTWGEGRVEAMVAIVDSPPRTVIAMMCTLGNTKDEFWSWECYKYIKYINSK